MSIGRILTYDKVAAIEHGVPYVLRFRAENGELLLYGGRHISDPEHRQISDIAEAWVRFKPTVAFNEGGNPPLVATREEAVARFSEPGLVRFLAQRDGIPVSSFEPPYPEEMKALLESYPAEQVKMYFALRNFISFRARAGAKSADAFMAGELAGTWAGTSPGTIGELQMLFEKYFRDPGDWRAVPEDWFNPTLALHFSNEMSSLDTTFRDRHIYTLLVSHVNEGKRVFAVIGCSHVIALEHALAEELGGPPAKRTGYEPAIP